MGMRREARERAIQFLYQAELNPPENVEEALEAFWHSQRQVVKEQEHGPANYGQPVEVPPPSAQEAAIRAFAEPLIRGTLEHRQTADDMIKNFSQNWSLHRIAKVDRCILRLAIFEMLHRRDIPPVVAINEAVDIAKKFSTQESGRFVNGLLDRVKQEILRPARTAQP